MPQLLLAAFALTICISCQQASSTRLLPSLVASADTLILPDTQTVKVREYSGLRYKGVTQLTASHGTKSVLFNSSGSLLYAMNLEGMSIYEYDRMSRKVRRKFHFKPTPATGWDYATDKPIPSFEEKPVEACLSHDDKILWVSLHNAKGIVPIWLDTIRPEIPDSMLNLARLKKIRVFYPETARKDSFDVPLIITGKTPKVISRTADNRNLLVSNWHSYNVSVVEVDTSKFPFANLVNNIPMSSIPRGIAIEEERNRSFVAIMGGSSLTVINNSVWMKEKDIAVESNPRHIVTDTSGHLFVSYNKLAKIACIDTESGKTLFTAKTKAQPRTLILSKNKKFLFVTCYSGDMVEVFRIDEKKFTRIASLPCPGHPVGVDIYEDDEKLEAWVCSYVTGGISVFGFEKE